MLHAQIKTFFSEPKAQKLEHVQTLWSGYGEIARYYLPNKNQKFILKVIDLAIDQQALKAHPRGWNTQVSHQRKLSSYHNEQSFYKHLAEKTQQNACKVPKLLGMGKNKQYMWLYLQDLDDLGYDYRVQYTGHNQQHANYLAWAKQCITWLANFHATFLNTNLQEVWPIGTYWHLATRQDEWQSMPNTKLKHYAKHIDNTLHKSNYQTLLHGDAKLANFCFNQKTQNVAAVDFQYTGKGVGIKDVVYFLGSCFDDEALFTHANSLVNEYFIQLKTALKHQLYSQEQKQTAHLTNINVEELEQQWRQLYPFAWADFERFLVGWSPEHYKLGEYSHSQTSKALELLF